MSGFLLLLLFYACPPFWSAAPIPAPAPSAPSVSAVVGLRAPAPVPRAQGTPQAEPAEGDSAPLDADEAEAAAQARRERVGWMIVGGAIAVTALLFKVTTWLLRRVFGRERE